MAAALGVKLIVLTQLHDHPLLQPTGALDTAVYVDLGRRVAAGDLKLGSEPYFLAPLYAYFLGLVFALSGGSLLAARVVQVGLGALAVGLVYATSRCWFEGRAPLLGTVLLAGTGIATFYEVTLLQAALDPFLTALALFLLARALPAGGAWRFGAAGLGLGLLSLNRPNALVFAPVLGLLLLRPKARWPAAGAFVAGVVLAIAPVTVRNWAVSGEPVLISSHGGLNFYIGNHAGADGTYRSLPGITPDIAGQARDAQRVAEAARGRPLTPREVSAYFFGLAAEWMRSHPGDALALFLRKAGYVLSNAEIALNHSYTYYARDEPTLLRFLVVGPWLLVPLGVFGLALRLLERRHDGFGLWAAFVPVYALSVAVFFVTSRYRLPLFVPLAVGAGFGLDRSIATAQRKDWSRLGKGALAILPLALLALWPQGLDDGRSEEGTALLEHLVDAGRSAEALGRLPAVEATHPQRTRLLSRVGQAFLDRREPGPAQLLLERAVSMEPTSANLREKLGLTLALSGREEEAIRELEEACQLDIRSASARLNLAVVLAQVGRTGDARARAEEALRLQPDYPQARGLLEALGRP